MNIKDVELICGEAISIVQQLPSGSIDMIVVDPPYYRVKGEAWDNQWPTPEAYLAWLESAVVEFQRLLKPNGSLYLFCSSRMSTDIEVMMRQHLHLLNDIVWAKPSGKWIGCHKESLRCYWPATERIIFAEQYGAEGSARAARETSGVTAADIKAATGVDMASHWFGYSQWQLPNQEQYEKLQTLFAERLGQDYQTLTKTYQGLHQTYRTLAASYEQLKVDFDRLRRPFAVSKHVPYTDVWVYPPVQHYPGKHPCEKPALMMEHIIEASSRPGDVVADFFMGSGATGKAAIKLGRRFIGVELERERFEQTRQEMEL